MTVYPTQLDSDLELPRVEDNITEIGGAAINSLRDAVIAIEYTLGVNPQGTTGNVATRLNVVLNPNGTLKASALSGLGLVTLPIINSMIAASAGIVESKLSLDYSTAALNALISALNTTVTGMNAVLTTLQTDFTLHIFGLPTPTTVDGYVNRHVGSHIDINNGQFSGYPQYTGIDPRDSAYYNTGLYDLTGTIRNARTVMDALIQINADLLAHALSTSSVKHPATFITLDTTNFDIIPKDKDNVQKAIDFIDDLESEVFEEHREEQHANGIPRAHRVSRQQDDGYNVFFGPFTCQTSTTTGGLGLVTFSVVPGDLDWAFRQLVPGDSITINYGGFIATYGVDTITYTPGAVYNIITDGYNLTTTTSATAILEKAKYDDNHYGALAVVPANHNFYSPPNDAAVPGSAIVVAPNCAAATGLDFSPEDLDSSHYMLYLAYYPTSDPSTVNLIPPTNIQAIDVTGNAGVTPGKYTLDGIIETVNSVFRSGGYNYRFVAFDYKGQFGIALADTIDNAAFSIISGTASGTTISPGVFTNNVVGDATSPIKDPLGFGMLKANVASPEYQTPTITSIPTQVIVSRRHRKYQINGQYIDYLQKGHLTNTDGYYDGYLHTTTQLGVTRTQGVYRVYQDLQNSDLKVGSTIVVYPTVSRSDPTFIEEDYGRYIVEQLDYGCCPTDEYTDITVVTCTSLSGDPIYVATTPPPNLSVRIYFSNDSVSFQNNDGDTYRNLFEVFIKEYGRTFSHKRARLPIKSPSFLNEINTLVGPVGFDTDYGWHITDVSPKLRGFFPVTSPATDLRKYVRFVMTDYDATDDSFDGYIGQPDDTVPGIGNIQNKGPTVRVRKGDIIRCYDNTGVDYIEINFKDKAYILPATAPINIAPTGSCGYMDIEIFETMRLNEEYMCLAVCEQYSGGSDKTSLWNFIDKREFGTISERNLTSSAIRFIEASDRAFRQNGVAHGLDFQGFSGSNLVFNGGTAVVDGVIVNKNNFIVYPFEMNDGSLPTTVVYALCIKRDGSYELIVIDTTPTTKQYNYGYETVYTLSELIATRKDLLPIYLFTVITASLTVDANVMDVRKFIANDEIRTPLVLSGPVQTGSDEPAMETSNFASWEAVTNYIKYSALLHSKIIVRGESTISPRVGSSVGVDFGNNPVEILGEPNNTVYCNNATPFLGIALHANMTIDGVNFVRQTTGALAYYGTTNVGAATVGIVVNDNSRPFIYENINIRNCTFDTDSAGGYRAGGMAHILFEETGPDSYSIFKNVTIQNNVFKESLTQLDIAFVNRDHLRMTNPTASYVFPYVGTMMHSVTIDNNTGNHDSWIMLSSDNYDSGSGSSRGLVAYGVKITNNNFTHMWLNLARHLPQGYNGVVLGAEYMNNLPTLHAAVLISNNVFNDIINRAIDGTLLGAGGTIFSFTWRQVDVASPTTIISDNRCTSINVGINGDLYNDGTYDYPYAASAITIENNSFTTSPYEAALFLPSDGYALVPPNDVTQYAIAVLGNMAIGHLKEDLVNINNNNFSNELQFFKSGTQVWGYNYGNVIASTVPCSISNNIMSNCISPNGNGIWLIYLTPLASGHGNSTYNASIYNNRLARGVRSINSYITVSGNIKIKEIFIKDNEFDSEFVDTGLTDSATIKYTDPTVAYKVIARGNANHRFFINMAPYIQNTLYANRADLPVSGAQISGWTKSDLVINPDPISGVGFGIRQYMLPSCISSSFPSATYSVSPLIVDVPYLGGAAMQLLTFSVRAYTPATPTLRVGIATQTDLLSTDAVIDFSAPQYTVTPATFVADASTNLISIDMSPLYARYPTIPSPSREFPIYIFFVLETTKALFSISNALAATGLPLQYIYITGMTAIFRY